MEAFERVKKIGKGNFGDVLLVRRKSDNMNFALKRVDLSNRDQFAVDPLNEVKVLKSLDHPNIIYHYDSFIHNNKLCIVMEYADNADLANYIKDYKHQNRFLPEDTVLFPLLISFFFNRYQTGSHSFQSQFNICTPKKFFIEISNYKTYSQQKMGQQFICYQNNQIKIGDFGISRTLENTQELAQTSIGTPFYLSPEICQSHSYNHKIDIWMLGCALYELCSLEKPFQGDSINAIVHKIMNEHPSRIPNHYSEFIADMVDWMLDKCPEQRPEISTIMQMPQMQKELCKLREFYENLNLKIAIPMLKPVGIKQEKKVNQNSIHFLVEKARQHQQQLSPLQSKRSRAKLVTQPQTQQKEEIALSQPNSPHFKSFKCEDNYVKQKSYQRVMSINTQLENNERKQQDESGPLTKPKVSFTFAEQIFNPNAPTSPNRTILLTDFLKRKLGEEKFNEMRILLETSLEPLKVLDEKRKLVIEILGEENMEYIKIFKILISNSVTPQASHFRNKSSQNFCDENKDDSILDLIKGVEFDPDMKTYPGFEISFKNFINYQE